MVSNTADFGKGTNPNHCLQHRVVADGHTCPSAAAHIFESWILSLLTQTLVAFRGRQPLPPLVPVLVPFSQPTPRMDTNCSLVASWSLTVLSIAEPLSKCSEDNATSLRCADLLGCPGGRGHGLELGTLNQDLTEEGWCLLRQQCVAMCVFVGDGAAASR